MNSESKRFKVNIFVKLIGFSLIPAAVAVLSIGPITGSYTLLDQTPLTSLLLALILFFPILIIPPVLFLLLVWHLCKTPINSRIPLKIPISMGILNILSFCFFVWAWKYAFAWQRIGFVIQNVIFVTAFWIIWSRVRNKATFSNTILLALIACCWLFWISFPVFGPPPDF